MEKMAIILLVDDDQSVRETLTDFLTGAGHEVVQVESGRQALESLAARSFDLIIIDVFMPDIGGIELIRLLSQKDDTPPLITISGGGGVLPPNWSIKSAKVYGVEYALTKPIEMPVFLSTVERALIGRGDADEINRSRTN